MSYARFSEGDIYIFLSIEGTLECCGCYLTGPGFFGHFDCATTDEMLAHIEEHRAAGHKIPERCVPQLIADRVENDKWIAEEATRG